MTVTGGKEDSIIIFATKNDAINVFILIVAGSADRERESEWAEKCKLVAWLTFPFVSGLSSERKSLALILYN